MNVKEIIDMVKAAKPCIDCVSCRMAAGYGPREFVCAYYGIEIKYPHVADVDCRSFKMKSAKIKRR